MQHTQYGVSIQYIELHFAFSANVPYLSDVGKMKLLQ